MEWMDASTFFSLARSADVIPEMLPADVIPEMLPLVSSHTPGFCSNDSSVQSCAEVLSATSNEIVNRKYFIFCFLFYLLITPLAFDFILLNNDFFSFTGCSSFIAGVAVLFCFSTVLLFDVFSFSITGIFVFVLEIMSPFSQSFAKAVTTSFTSLPARKQAFHLKFFFS